MQISSLFHRRRAESGAGRATLPSDGVDFEIVTDPARFAALEPEWDQLWARSAEPRFTNSFAWRNAGWLSTGVPRKRRLAVLVMHVDGALALIWPMTVGRKFWLWRQAQPLGPEYTEYEPVVVEAGPQAADHVARAWAYLRRAMSADIILMPWVREAAATQKAVSGDASARHAEMLPSPVVDCRAYPSFEDYWGARSSKHRGNLNRLQRRLGEYGKVEFDRVTDLDEYDRLLDWTILTKLAWMKARHLQNDFLAEPEFRAFAARMADARTPAGQWGMWALRLDGRVIATTLGALDAYWFEGFFGAQDPALESCSLGSIMLLKMLQWLYPRNIGCDLRIGSEDYKRLWATADRPATTYRIANTGWGAVGLAIFDWLQQARVTKDRLRERIPKGLRMRFKSLARRLTVRLPGSVLQPTTNAPDIEPTPVAPVAFAKAT